MVYLSFFFQIFPTQPRAVNQNLFYLIPACADTRVKTYYDIARALVLSNREQKS